MSQLDLKCVGEADTGETEEALVVEVEHAHPSMFVKGGWLTNGHIAGNGAIDPDAK